MNAPVHRAQPLVDKSLLKKSVKSFQHDRLILRTHGRVRIIETAEHANAFELLALKIKKFLGVTPALQTNIYCLHLQFFATQHLVNFDLDGQTMAIPSRDIGRVESGHCLRLDDEVLETLVESVPKMNRTIGIGRPVMQNITGCRYTGLANLLINLLLLPSGQQFGLILRQVGLHGKSRSGQINSGFQIERHLLVLSQMVDLSHYRDGWKPRPSDHCGRRKYRTYRNLKSTIGGHKKRVQFLSKVTFCASKRLKGRRSADSQPSALPALSQSWLEVSNTQATVARNVLIIE